ncbi:flavodoxin FldA [Enterobacteriaceae endosymbiont of Donacia versicolorea]|uniref:flavodoxin FldA n=1 Tax=unclassified Enterobacteriaceae TaxID=36866 RepID=UPI001448B484|nr:MULTISPECIES: flavodoxin FldA [unclassified Enterobacteriaceae]QJC32157.1 flavodoxin FldA [Enterobacteriaceae endosymbiont of Donacia versicolorea]QJC32557.1 flavodoxin FldA [Enterobacteriaceae endosymbiont of Donacia dentata]
MSKIGIFFGSDTGNTENVALKIQKQLGNQISSVFNISQTEKKDIEKYNIILFGIPTWYYGEVQCDWDDFLPILQQINFKNKIISLFGCGDQEDYGDYFCDAIKIIYDITKKNKAQIIGYWPTKGYNFYSTKSLKNKNYFLGLTIDEDRQPELTNSRIITWTKQISKELKK